MADPIEVVRAVLAAAAPVTSLVGDRISEVPRAQGDVLPAVVLNLISRVPTNHLQGDGRLDTCRVQVDSYAASRAAAAALAAAVRTALSAPDRLLLNELGDYDEETETAVFTQDYSLWIDPTA